MPPDIAKKIKSFHGQLQEDKHHRYMSWEHCYSYFREDKIDVDKACLHIKINPHTPSFAGIKKLVSFYVENINQFVALSSEIIADSKIIYPPMKLIDMYFWQIGFDEDQK